MPYQKFFTPIEELNDSKVKNFGRQFSRSVSNLSNSLFGCPTCKEEQSNEPEKSYSVTFHKEQEYCKCDIPTTSTLESRDI